MGLCLTARTWLLPVPTCLLQHPIESLDLELLRPSLISSSRHLHNNSFSSSNRCPGSTHCIPSNCPHHVAKHSMRTRSQVCQTNWRIGQTRDRGQRGFSLGYPPGKPHWTFQHLVIGTPISGGQQYGKLSMAVHLDSLCRLLLTICSESTHPPLDAVFDLHSHSRSTPACSSRTLHHQPR